MEGAATDLVAIGAVSTIRATTPPVVPALDADLGLGQILGAADPHSGIGAIFARSWHDVTPERRVLPGITAEDGEVFTDPARFPCYRLQFQVVLCKSSSPWGAGGGTPRVVALFVSSVSQDFCTFPEVSASCDPAHEALNEPADFWRKPATDGRCEYSPCIASRLNS